MSLSGALKIQLSKLNQDVFENAILSLVNHGWSASDHGKISYMIEGSFDWSSADLHDLNEVIKKIKSSIARHKEAGLVLTWKNTGIGGNFLFISSTELLFSLTNYPHKLTGIGITDFSWYIEKMLPLFTDFEFVRLTCIYD